MIPIYIFYSMFGFQRTGDAFWAAADQMTRGFVLGATAGRTTLNGEGLQHEDGHSSLLASTNPAAVAYDPAFAYEVGHIIKDALRRMYGERLGGDVFYYLTVYNEPYVQPKEPEDVDVEGILARHVPRRRGARGRRAQGADPRLRRRGAVGAGRPAACSPRTGTSRPTSGRSPRGASCAATGSQSDEHNLMNPEASSGCPYVTRKLEGAAGPFVAVSDWMRAVQDQIAPWVPGDFASLGTDGFGLSDTRAALRRHFQVDAWSIVAKTLAELARRGEVKPETAREAIDRYRIWDVTAPPAGETEGGAE